ncbi:Ribosomal protein S6 kinase alpha-5, partial [Fragariocoptes setiger]
MHTTRSHVPLIELTYTLKENKSQNQQTTKILKETQQHTTQPKMRHKSKRRQDLTEKIYRRLSRVDMTNFETLKVLGTGAYGKVFLVRKIGGHDHGKLYAMKVLRKATIVQKQKTLEHTKTERQVLEAIRDQPFLVTMHYAFQTSTKLHIILDYVSGGELFTHLYQRDHFNEDQVRIYVGEIVLALERLHKLSIIYRDIKLENILLDSDGHIVLTDFGLCKEFSPNDTDQRAYSFCGTIEYMSPELIKGGTSGHDFSVDWWSVGVLTYELLTGASPFTVEGERNTQVEISRRILKNQPPIPDHLSPSAKDFIRRLLVKDPKKRLGGKATDALEIKRHRFFDALDWNLLAQRKIPAPFLPTINHELDVSNFAEEFTSMLPILVVGQGDQDNIDDIVGIESSSDDSSDDDQSDDDQSDDSTDEEEDDDDDDCGEVGDLNQHFDCLSEIVQQRNNDKQLLSLNISTIDSAQKMFPQSKNHCKRLKLASDGSSRESSLAQTEPRSSSSSSNFTRLNPAQTGCVIAKQSSRVIESLSKPNDLSFRYSQSIVDLDALYTVKNTRRTKTTGKNLDPVTDNLMYSHLKSSESTNNYNYLFRGYSYVNPKAVEWFKHNVGVKHIGRRKSKRHYSHLADSNQLEYHVMSLPNDCTEDSHFDNLTSNPVATIDLNSSYCWNSDQVSVPVTCENIPNYPGEDCTALIAQESENLIHISDNGDISLLQAPSSTQTPIETGWSEYELTNQNLSATKRRVAFTIGDDDIATAMAASVREARFRRASEIELFNAQIMAPVTHEVEIASVNSENYTHRVMETIASVSEDSCSSPRKKRASPASASNELPKRRKKNHNLKTNGARKVLRHHDMQFDTDSTFFRLFDCDLTSDSSLLGDGSFSVCRTCTHRETGIVYAVKILSRRIDSSREVKLLRQCQEHPNIVRLYDVYQDDFNTYIVCEYLKGGELLERIRRRKCFTEAEACRIFRGLVSAVDYLHSKRICHRDIKPENLLFEHEGTDSNVKLIDFGFAREMPSFEDEPMKTPCFTLGYCAPEVLDQALLLNIHSSIARKSDQQSSDVSSASVGERQSDACEEPENEGYNESCDLWSLGVILYAMLSGHAPFQAFKRKTDPIIVMEKIKSGEFSFSMPQWKLVSQDAKDVIRGLLTVDPHKRLTMQQLLHSQWLMGYDALPCIHSLNLAPAEAQSSSWDCQLDKTSELKRAIKSSDHNLSKHSNECDSSLRTRHGKNELNSSINMDLQCDTEHCSTRVPQSTTNCSMKALQPLMTPEILSIGCPLTILDKPGPRSDEMRSKAIYNNQNSKSIVSLSNRNSHIGVNQLTTNNLRITFEAFHQAYRQGFRLCDLSISTEPRNVHSSHHSSVRGPIEA